MFQGLSTALTALYANRQALETTGNNIANANTEGYARQRVDLSETAASSVAAFYSTSPKSGFGVNVQDITRVRDAFLETRSLQENGTQSKLDANKDALARVELSFGEPGDNGLQNQLATFWSSWDDAANNVGNDGDLASRSQILEQGQSLVSSFQQTSSDLKALAVSSTSQLKGDVAQLNSMAQNIADLNKSIQLETNAGSTPNALLDQRDLLISKMSKIAGVVIQPTEAGSVAVLVGGVPIVRDARVMTLQVNDTVSPATLNWDVDKDPATVTDGFPASVSGGQIAGLLNTITTTVPKYLSQIDNVAGSIITAVNNQHALGVDKNGNAGGVFFTGTTASDIALDPTLAGDPALVAAAKTGSGAADGENARAMAQIAEQNSGPDAVYRQLIDVLGVESQRASRQVDIQSTITSSVDSAKESVSGVNLDEEMTNMVRFQKSYNAAAKYMGVINDSMDTLMAMVR